MTLPGRTSTGNDYRYGFQGQEKDDELKGPGNSLNYTFRMHDPRVGRFFAVDPLAKEYPELTPYQFASNSVIDMVEIEGLEGGWIVNSQGQVQYAQLGPRRDTYFKSYHEASKAAKIGLKTPSSLSTRNTFVSRAPSVQKPQAMVRQSNEHQKYAIHNPGYVMAPMIATGMNEFTEDFLMGGILLKLGRGYKYVKGFKTISKIDGEITKTFAYVYSSKPCGCFNKGTQVLTEFGYKNIEDIKVGDKVWAYDDATGNLALKEVIDTFTREFEQIYKIYFGDEVLEATHEHPFFIGGKWLKVDELKVGDLLTLYDGTTKSISKIEFTEGNFEVYNFTVDQFHTYYVSKQNILVHNGIPCSTLLGFDKFKGLKVAKEYLGKKQGGLTQEFTISEKGDILLKGKPANGDFDFVVTNEGTLKLGKGHYHLSGMADEVKSAGRVGIDNGKITYLDNQSGHYRPDSSRLIETANTFAGNGIMSPQGAFINNVR